MTQDEIIEMLRASCETLGEPYDGQFWTLITAEIGAFAKLVAAKEREACAKICEKDGWATGFSCADAIRARGEAT